MPQRDLGVEGRCCPRFLSESEAKQLFQLLLRSREDFPELTPSKGHIEQALGSNSIRGIAAGLSRPRGGSATHRNQVSLLERPAPVPSLATPRAAQRPGQRPRLITGPRLRPGWRAFMGPT